MPYKEITGNLFASKADALVNTVNCVGVMGKGVALEFRRRFPEMFKAYQEVCKRGGLQPGSILPYRRSMPWVLNFAVKNDWKHPSKIVWIEQCLEKFCAWYPKAGLQSVAFPWIGAMNGGIPLDKIQEITRKYLQDLEDIDIEVYTFDPNASDPLFDKLEEVKRKLSTTELKKMTGIRENQVAQMYEILDKPEVSSITHVVESRVLGKTSIDRLYSFLSTQTTSGKIVVEPSQKGQLGLFN